MSTAFPVSPVVNLMSEFEDRPRSTFLEAGQKSTHWYQHSGTTLVRQQAADSDVQDGRENYAATVPGPGVAVRMVTRRTFGPDLDVFGWFRIFDWDADVKGREGVKLYTGFEDNNANNTIGLLRNDGLSSWYMEDRVGTYPNRDDLQGQHQVSSTAMSVEEHVRYRFFWRQRAVEENGEHGLRGTLWVDGQQRFSFFNHEPLYVGRIGWRLDRTGTDWFLMVREH